MSLWGSGQEGQVLLDYYLSANPKENPNLYRDLSPLYKVRNIKTPVVMYQGDADVNVPPAMTWIAYRALQQYSSAPVELFIFPGTGHDFISNFYRKRKLIEDIKWFDKYLFYPEAD